MNASLRCLLGLTLAAPLTAQNPQHATFASGCSGSLPTARLILMAPPVTGSTLQVDVTNLPANAAFMFLGMSNTASPLGPLPLALAPLGMPGCVAYVSPDATVLMFGTGNRATFDLTIPATPQLAGVRLFQQALVLDPGAGNAVASVVSDAADMVLGLPGWPFGGTPVANMVPIAAGSFAMGSTQGLFWELPVHTVTLTQPFWMGKYEVTQAEYQAVMNSNPAYFQGASYPNSANRPVEQVTWNDAMAYCAALTAQEAAAGRLPTWYQYRLPTEAEWEYSCRAGTTTEWNVGSSLSCWQANHWPFPSPACVGQTSVVGSHTANAFGLHDMHGNVWEWCLDCWDGNSGYPLFPLTNPYFTIGPNRIIRGGTFGGIPSYCRSAIRGAYGPSSSQSSVGFRVVLAP